MQKVKKLDRGLFIFEYWKIVQLSKQLKDKNNHMYKTKENKVLTYKMIVICTINSIKRFVNMKNLINDLSDNLLIKFMAFSFSLKKWEWIIMRSYFLTETNNCFLRHYSRQKSASISRMVSFPKYEENYVLHFTNAKNQAESVLFLTLECVFLLFSDAALVSFNFSYINKRHLYSLLLHF